MVLVHVGGVLVQGLVDAVLLDGAADVDVAVPRHEGGDAVAVHVRDVGLALGGAVGLERLFNRVLKASALTYNSSNTIITFPFVAQRKSVCHLSKKSWVRLG